MSGDPGEGRTREEFEDHDDLVGGLEGVPEHHHVGVVELADAAHDGHLGTQQLLGPLLVPVGLGGHHLEGHLLVRAWGVGVRKGASEGVRGRTRGGPSTGPGGGHWMTALLLRQAWCVCA